MESLKILTLLSVCNLFFTGSNAEVYLQEEIAALKLILPLVNQSLYREYMRSDAFLITYLRTSNLQLQEASDMILKTMKWRQDHRIDEIVNEVIPIEKEMPYDLRTVDWEGRPVYSMKIAEWDLRKYTLSGKAYDAHRVGMKIMEQVGNLIRHYAKLHPTNNHNITKVTALVDLNGYSWKLHACPECLRLSENILVDIEAHWPQICANFLFFNSPRIFEVTITVLKAFMDYTMKNGLHTYGYDREEYTRELLKFIPPDELEKILGKNSAALINNLISGHQEDKHKHTDQQRWKMFTKTDKIVAADFFETDVFNTEHKKPDQNASINGSKKYTARLLALTISIFTMYSASLL